MAAELRSLSTLPVATQSFHKCSQFSLAPSNCNFPISNLALSFRTSKCHHHVLRFPHLLPVFCSSSAVATEKQAIEPVTEALAQTRVLAQNIPWSATVDDIRALFEKHGSVLDVEVPMYDKTKNKGLAFVEMASAEEAVEAISKLEGLEFEGRNLKLNYANPKKQSPVQPKRPIVFNLYVGNLSFAARADDLREFFTSNGHKPAQSGVVMQGKPRKPAGYGFVSFTTKREADAALSAFQGKEFMGREIRVAKSNRFVKVVNEKKPRKEDVDGLPIDEISEKQTVS